MSWLRILALFAGIATIPVISLARTAIGLVWSAPVTLFEAAVMVLLIGGTFFLVATLAVGLWPKYRTVVVSSVGWFALGFLHAGQLRGALHSAGWAEVWHWTIFVLAVAGFAVWIGTRFDPAARYLATFVPILVAIQGFLLVVDLVQVEEPAPVTAAVGEAAVGAPPSIWVIVLDGHASPKVLRDLHGVDISESTSRLETAGFRVWDDARSNYSHTLVSIPSVLSGEVWDPETIETSYGEMLAGVHGDTPLVASMGNAGYTIRMIPTNWSRSKCGAIVDDCIGDPRYDEHWYFLLLSTPLPDLFLDTLAHPWPTGGLETLDIVADLDDAGPHFTFVHSLASHPPTVLGAECNGVSSLKGLLADQLRCTHDSLFEAVSSIALTADIVIVTADHGYALGDLSSPPETWTDSIARGRFSAFTAISTPGDCEADLPDELSTAQILPSVLNCYGAELPVPPHRFLKVNHLRGGVGATELAWDGWSTYTP